MAVAAIVDYGIGNLFSVQSACEHVGLKGITTSRKEDILSADGIILPGVGAFGDAMARLKELDLIYVLADCVQNGKPLMGICLGMQLLMSYSEEFGHHKGLGFINGAVVRFSDQGQQGKISKVPEVGWNRVFLPGGQGKDFWNKSPLNDINNGEFMYFVHSYYVVTENPSQVLAVTRYGTTEYCSCLRWQNVFATQFHPERSAAAGLHIYKNWAMTISSELCKK